MLIIMLVLIPFGIFPSYVFQLIKMSKWQNPNSIQNQILSPINCRLNVEKHSQNVNTRNQKRFEAA